MKLTIDASVHLNALDPREDGSSDSRVLLNRVHREPADGRVEVYCPTLLAVEVAAAVARVFDHAVAIELSLSLRRLPGQTMIPLSELLAEETSRLAAKHRLRGSDAVYGAVAQLYGSVLVTCDPVQAEKLAPAVTVWQPGEALRQLAS